MDWKDIKSKKIKLLAVLTVVTFNAFGQDETSTEPYERFVAIEEDPLHSVDPFIGTGGHGHTFPGPTMPFGMVQLSPDTRLDGWDGCSGYHYSDSVIYGFSHTHLSGTGVSDYADVLITPMNKAVDAKKLPKGNDRYKIYGSGFKKENERAMPGFYQVDLDNGIRCEMTSTNRTGIHLYSASKAGTMSFAIDLQHRDKLVNHKLEIINNKIIQGYRISEAWAKEQHVYLYAEFSRPFKSYSLNDDGSIAIVEYDCTDTSQIMCKVGISPVDIQGAKNNLETEAPHWHFGTYTKAAQDAWRKELQKIRVEGGSRDDRIKFYTALYHTMIAPNIFMDVDGRYRGTDLKVHLTDKDNPQFTIFSLWDTFRATHPLYTLTQPIRTKYFLQTFLRQYRDGGQLPVWELAGNYTGCMIGYHSVSVIADAAAKGYINKNAIEMYLEASLHSAEQNHLGLDTYKEFNFIPSDKEHESVSKTLEYAYDDWCIAKMAELYGNKDVAAKFYHRSQNYKNLFTDGYMAPKLNGGWRKGFDPKEVNFNYTEANAWQYSYFVPHDVNGMIELHGGKDKFARHIDSMFICDDGTTGRQQVDITGLIGQYAHGNEPSHHIPFLYHYLNQPHKTIDMVNYILDSLYTTAPDGLSGNEDCGQMSAWYVMAAMGLYQICPGDPNYVIFPPKFDAVHVSNEHGKVFSSYKYGDGNYPLQVKMNERLYPKSYVNHETLIGKKLVFNCTDKVSNWGTLDDHVPSTSIPNNYKTIALPSISSSNGQSFVGETEITLEHPSNSVSIFYSIDGSEAKEYILPFTIDESRKITAYATLNDLKSSTAHASFNTRQDKFTVDYIAPYNNQYIANGDLTLYDGIKGNEDFRTDTWQGFYDVDFEVSCKLNKKQKISSVEVGFLQDIRSWIWFPTEMTVEISKNGKRWKKIGAVENSMSTHTYGAKQQRYKLEIDKAKKAKYVRIKAKNYGPNPEWHLGKGKPTWLFSDEIEIN